MSLFKRILAFLRPKKKKKQIGTATSFPFLDLYGQLVRGEITLEQFSWLAERTPHTRSTPIYQGDPLPVTKEERVRKPSTRSLAIALPSDKKLVERLEAKLDEYKKRLTPAPLADQQNLYFKLHTLESLLKTETGEIQFVEISNELRQRIGHKFDYKEFVSAYRVIKDYCETGGENVLDGALPETQ